MADNLRFIPLMFDGLKPGQRKVIVGCFKRKLTVEIKVVKLAGYVLEHSAYHHGDVSLTQTIVGLAQDFVGSNNVNLLSPNGQFGTRGMGGKDAASARYIFTALPKMTRAIFHQSDDALLNYLNDDGQSIEPEWYMPTVPLVLINGGEGIGTGWSTHIPNYNPHDIVANLRRKLRGEEVVSMKPWYRGFMGLIEDVGLGKFKISGCLNQIDEATWEITELPIRTWTSSYKEGLEERVVGSDKSPATIKEYKEYHTDTTVHFLVKLNDKGIKEVESKGAEAFFKISSHTQITNMVLFDAQGKIKKYSTPEKVLDEFFLLRLRYYQKRKESLVEELKTIYERLSNQARFVQMIVNRQLVVSNRKRADLVKELRGKDFRPFPKPKKAKIVGEVNVDENGFVEEGEEESVEFGSGDFDYLLSMPIWNLTKEKVDRLLAQRDEREKELKILLSRNAENLWEQDLEEFLVEWDAMLTEDARRLSDTGKNGKSKGGKTSAKAKKGGPAARNVLKGSDDGVDFMGDSEDDYVPMAAKASKSVAVKTTIAASHKPASMTMSPKSKKRVASSLLGDYDATLLAGPARKVTAAKQSKLAVSASKKSTQSKLNFNKEKAEPAFTDIDDSDYIMHTTVAPKPAAEKGTSRTAAKEATSAPKMKRKIIEDSDADVTISDDDASPLKVEPRSRAPSRRAASAAKTKKYAVSDEETIDGDDGDSSFSL